jgi:hypothetical protein
MTPPTAPEAPPTLPFAARALGLAGLIPQGLVVAALVTGGAEMGGTRTPSWAWVAAVVPSLLALASAWPWATGGTWPGPSLIFLGLAIAASLLVDLRLRAAGLAPGGWLALRVPLSLGLGGLTVAVGILSLLLP